MAQAVSWVRAVQTRYWQDGDALPPGHEPYFDADQIHDCVRRINEHNAAWRDWFATFDVRPHLVRYEDLIADMAGVMQGILGFLGLEIPGDRTIAPGHHRQADDINREWIARYRASGVRVAIDE